jgi:hypothetical protein
MPQTLWLGSLFLLLILTGCERPAVAVNADVGHAGMFCITAADCVDGLGCLHQHCCENERCASICQSMLEKNSNLVSNGLGSHPSLANYYRRRCLTLCCEGKNSDQIEDFLLGRAARTGGHGGNFVIIPLEED